MNALFLSELELKVAATPERLLVLRNRRNYEAPLRAVLSNTASSGECASENETRSACGCARSIQERCPPGVYSEKTETEVFDEEKCNIKPEFGPEEVASKDSRAEDRLFRSINAEE